MTIEKVIPCLSATITLLVASWDQVSAPVTPVGAWKLLILSRYEAAVAPETVTVPVVASAPIVTSEYVVPSPSGR